MVIRSVLFAVATVASTVTSVGAQWQLDGIPLDPTQSSRHQRVVSDGAGGAFVVGQGIIAQRISAAGIVQWPSGHDLLGVGTDPSCSLNEDGNLLVTWISGEGCDSTFCILAQKLSPDGAKQWPQNVSAVSSSYRVSEPQVVSDGAGGAIVAWLDRRHLDHDAIYAQRFDAAGVAQWQFNGVLLSGASHPNPDSERYFQIVSDNDGGAIFTFWTSFSRVHVQRVRADGSLPWGVSGVLIFPGGNSQNDAVLVEDDAGGAIVAWQDREFRIGDAWAVLAQRVNAAGTKLWGDTPAIVTGAGYQIAIARDGDGGAVIAWENPNLVTGYDLGAQRIDASGGLKWGGGIAVCATSGNQRFPEICTDGMGGAIVAWSDTRGSHPDIYAQILDAAGFPRGIVDGFPICQAGDEQRSPVIAPAETGKAIAVWQDRRDHDRFYLYAGLVEEEPTTAVAILSFDASVEDGNVSLACEFRSDLAVHRVNVYRSLMNQPLAEIDYRSGSWSGRFDYTDTDVLPGRTYQYRLGVEDFDGEFLSPIVTVAVPEFSAALQQNQPNPFNVATTIRFVLPERAHVSLAVYDAHGRLVQTLVDSTQDAGTHEVQWIGRNHDGAPVASGVYFCRLQAASFSASKRMVLTR